MSKQKNTTTVSTVTTDGKPKQGKVNGYHSEKLHAKRDKKRQEAKSRHRHYESLTIKERITLAKSRPGNSKRELNRLYNLMDVKVSPKAEVIKVEAVTEKKTRKSDIVREAKANRPSKS